MKKNAKKTEFTRSKFLAASMLAVSLLCGGLHPIYAEPAPQESVSSRSLYTISGTVVDEKGEPIVGANVMERGTTRGVMTDIMGKYSFKVSRGGTVIVSYLGYKTKDFKATESTINVALTEDNALLDEVVVLGYGQQKKVNVTGAVSTVDIAKTMEGRPTQDVSKALQGAVPGLSVVSNQGGINSEPTLTIRGIGTLSNSESSPPLIVVDGVPMDDISFLNTQDIQSVSVLKDAASTSIYGTRAAFGVILITTKAAKAVDRVSVTYSGNFGWSTPTYLPNYPSVPSQIKALSAANSRAGLENELFGMYLDTMLPYAEKWEKDHGGKKAGYRSMIAGEDYVVNADGSGAMYFADWDVQKIMFKDWTPSMSHNISLQGTSGKTSYFASVGYDSQEGVMKWNPDKLKKYTANLSVTSNVTDWLQVGARVNYSNKEYTTPAVRRDTYTYMWRWGSFFGPYGTINGSDCRNDIAYRTQAGDDKTVDSYLRLCAFVKANITKDITVNADYTYSSQNYANKAAYLPVTGYNTWGGNISSLTDFNAQSTTSLNETTVRNHTSTLNIYGNYAKTIDMDHHINVMLGGNAETNEYHQFWAARKVLLDNNLPEFGLATGDQTVGGSHTHWGACGYFGRVNYDYKGIYLLELNGRYDGSSRFPKSDHWAFFPSGSVGYRFSEEKYFEKLKSIVSNGKFRASYGEIGNQAVGDYKFLSTISAISAGSTNWLNGNGVKVSEYTMPSLVSSSLKWERIETLDLGLDLGLLNDEVTFGFDWYQRTTKDMLAQGKALPDVLGDDAPLVNAGELRSRGWEVNVDWRHNFSGWNVYVNANISDVKTKVMKWVDDSRLINSYYSGKNYGDIWGFETDRYFTKDDFTYDANGKITGYAKGVASQAGLQQDAFVYGPGDIKFVDRNGDGVIDGGKGTAEDHGDLKVIGNSMPRYQYGFHIGGSWKGFDLDCFFQGVGQWHNWTQSAFVMPLMRGADAIYANQTSYWTEDNPDPNAEFPRLYPGNAGYGTVSGLARGNHNFYPQSKYLVSLAYLRFKNLTFGYTLPQALTRKAYIDKARFYFSANNLCELIKNNNAPLDPEINTSESTTEGTNDLANGTWGRVAPITRTISVGAQITF